MLIRLKIHILPHSPPLGVPVLRQNWPVKVNVSLSLVSNVQSKFYRLDLDLDLAVFFFKFKATKKFQYFELFDFVSVRWRLLSIGAPLFFSPQTSRNVGKTYFPVISTSNKFKKYSSYSYNMFMSGPQATIFRKFWFEKKLVSHQSEKVRWLEK